jgi:hypothetical protein
MCILDITIELSFFLRLCDFEFFRDTTLRTLYFDEYFETPVASLHICVIILLLYEFFDSTFERVFIDYFCPVRDTVFACWEQEMIYTSDYFVH